MIEGKFVGPGVYVKELDATYSWKELNKCSLKEFKQFCGCLDEKELTKVLNSPNLSDAKQIYIMNFFDRL